VLVAINQALGAIIRLETKGITCREERYIRIHIWRATFAIETRFTKTNYIFKTFSITIIFFSARLASTCSY